MEDQQQQRRVDEAQERILRAVGRAQSTKVDDIRNKLNDVVHVARSCAQYNPFSAFELVTPREDHGYAGAGKPYMVIKTTRLERNRFGFGTPGFGKMVDTWVAFLDIKGTVQTLWVESFAFRKWEPLTDGVAYDKDAEKAGEAFREQLAALGLEPETASVINNDGTASHSSVPPAAEHSTESDDDDETLERAFAADEEPSAGDDE